MLSIAGFGLGWQKVLPARIILPAIGVILTAFAFYKSVYPAPPAPLRWMPCTLLGFIVVGLIVGLIGVITHPVGLWRRVISPLLSISFRNCIVEGWLRRRLSPPEPGQVVSPVIMGDLLRLVRIMVSEGLKNTLMFMNRGHHGDSAAIGEAPEANRVPVEAHGGVHHILISCGSEYLLMKPKVQLGHLVDVAGLNRDPRLIQDGIEFVQFRIGDTHCGQPRREGLYCLLELCDKRVVGDVKARNGAPQAWDLLDQVLG